MPRANLLRWGLRCEMVLGHFNYLGLLKKDRKSPLFKLYIELFRGKKSIIHIQ